jgi:hypothetical protein
MEEPPPSWLDRELSAVNTLWLRVWWRAVCDYVLYQDSAVRRQRRLADEAATWLFEDGCSCDKEECGDARLSFSSFCSMFNRNPVTVRRWLLTLTPADVGRMGRTLL